MILRIARLPVIAGACLIAGVLVGLVLAPASAQQPMSGVDGQVAVRSDYAVYLISGGQRRWVATVMISDDEINAYPEAEPIFTGLAPLAAQQPAAPPPPTVAASPAPAAPPPPTQAPAPAAQPAAPQPPPATPAPAAQPPANPAQTAPTPFPTPNGATSEIDPLLPIEVDIDGQPIFEPGNEMNVVVKSKAGASCELTVRWPDATEADQPTKTADSRGRCSYTFRVPQQVPVGLGILKGSVREGGRVSRQTVEFQIVADLQ